MTYALLDHPELGHCSPWVMIAEMLSLRYEISILGSLF
jgi:hypothetical protein